MELITSGLSRKTILTAESDLLYLCVVAESGKFGFIKKKKELLGRKPLPYFLHTHTLILIGRKLV